MKILIMMGNISPNDDANSNIAGLVAKSLKQSGHEVSMLGTVYDCTVPLYEVNDGLVYHRCLINTSFLSKKFDRIFSNPQNSKFDKLKLLLGNPEYLLHIIVNYLMAKCTDARRNRYASLLRKLDKQEHYDRIVAITSPFYVVESAIAANTGAKIEWYQLDPHSSNPSLAYRRRKNLLREEFRIMQKVSHAIVPRLVYEENKRKGLLRYMSKITPANFPNVRALTVKPTEDDIVFDKAKINCVFVGMFYEDIRSPEFLLEMLTAMEAENIVVHFIGNGGEEIIVRYADKLKGRLILHGRHTLQASLNAIQNADIVLNIGNKASNMLPSKINDYISAGKPIFNIISIPDCPTVPYLQAYPYCRSIMTEVSKAKDIAKEFEAFCYNYYGLTADYAEVAMLYRTSTPEFLAGLILKG